MFVSVTSQQIEVAPSCGKSTSLSPKILQSFKANESYLRNLLFYLYLIKAVLITFTVFYNTVLGYDTV